MRALVTALVIGGAGASLLAGVARGLDALGSILLALIFLLGALAITLAIGMRRGRTMPAPCGRCGRLGSITASFCNGCGAALDGSDEVPRIENTACAESVTAPRGPGRDAQTRRRASCSPRR